MVRNLAVALFGAALIVAAGQAAAGQSQVVQARPYTMAPGDSLSGAPATRPQKTARKAPGEILEECGTNPGTGGSPPNVGGAVSPRRIVVVTNSSIGTYHAEDCTLISRETLKKFIEGAFPLGPNDDLLEARVIYDPRMQRFFLAVTSDNRFNRAQTQFFAVSKNGTDWFQYRVVLSEQDVLVFCKRAPRNWWNSPSAGKNDNRWFIAASERDVENLTSTGAILNIDKAPTIEGAPTKVTCFNDLDTNLQAPIVLDDEAKAYFLSTGENRGDAIRRYSLHTKGVIDQDILDTGLSSIPVPEWRRPPDVAQPNGERLYTNDGRFVSPTIQVGHRLFNVHSIRVDNAARVRLYKFSTGGGLIHDLLLPAAAGENHFNASIATASADDAAPAFVTYSRTMPADQAKGRLAMMMAVGPNGKDEGWNAFVVQTSAGQYSKTRHGRACNDSSISACFFGFWSTTQIDPQNPNRAWGFNQLITTGSIGGAGSEFNWTTRAALLKAGP